MASRRLPLMGLLLPLAAALAACGASTTSSTTATPGAAATPAPAAALQDWPEFDLTPQRYGSTAETTGITAANVGHLHRRVVQLPGTVDSSAVYLHGATVDGATHNTAFVTTTYGKTIALDADTGKILWTFTPSGYAKWAGSGQVTTATPLIDPDDEYLYAASPGGKIYKLAIASGQPAAGWPVTVTFDPVHEKIASALNMDGPDLLLTTGGYYGDVPPYVGHVMLIDRSSGHVVAVWNSLCANRHALIHASTCSASDSAIWGRAGAVVEPDGRILVATGNAPYNGTTNFGDSIIELDYPSLTIHQVYTPTNQAQLNSEDLDLGSSSPVLLSSTLVVQAGKDSTLRVLRLDALDGHPPGGRARLGGQIQSLPTPGNAELFSAPAVYTSDGHTTLFVADPAATGAYALVNGRLRPLWSNGTGGTSPVVAGGLLYVYDLNDGGVKVYRPGSSHAIATLQTGNGHWNSPIVVDGKVIEPEGNYMQHSEHGVLDIFSAG